MSLNRLLVILVAILCITALAIVGIAQGIDGALLTAAFAIVGGLAGWTGAKLHEHFKDSTR